MVSLIPRFTLNPDMDLEDAIALASGSMKFAESANAGFCGNAPVIGTVADISSVRVVQPRGMSGPDIGSNHDVAEVALLTRGNITGVMIE